MVFWAMYLGEPCSVLVSAAAAVIIYCCLACVCVYVCRTVISDKALELINIGSAAAVVHYDIPVEQNRFASRLLTMKSYFSFRSLQNRVSTILLLSEILMIIHWT